MSEKRKTLFELREMRQKINCFMLHYDLAKCLDCQYVLLCCFFAEIQELLEQNKPLLEVREHEPFRL